MRRFYPTATKLPRIGPDGAEVAPASSQAIVFIGSPGWTRTNDQRINSPTLYQLSYRGTGEGIAKGREF